ncbi:metal-dependent hydrolase [Sulfurimonas sp. MAG313]|nr:metal-dependent hydrolase [Sulfurimonas sp. MAG313]MDF1879896.1 metal-dependent hydrolase [Sulfurimonas sp. MAG313]
MKILNVSYILQNNEVISGKSLAFEKTILKIAPLDELLQIYPDAQVIDTPANSIVMPGLINAHVHLEFSANKTHLKYGQFMPWLYSVIENREDLIEGSFEAMKKATHKMLQSGITSFGAISSHGMDLEVAEQAKQNVVFFNEVIGSQATMADALLDDFKSRLAASESIKREGFYPAVAIHSPYSVHPALIKKAIEIAWLNKYPLSAHYMESPAERQWLDKNKGEFKTFFNDLLKQDYAVNTSTGFLELFKDVPTLFTHVVHANEEEYKEIKEQGHSIIHCPISNRLLGNGSLDLDAVQKHGIRWLCATDGLSSNYTLNLFEEMKIALFMHKDANLLELAKALLNSVTIEAAQALNLNTGSIELGKNADLIVLDLEDEATEQLPIHLILQQYVISHRFINGHFVNIDE